MIDASSVGMLNCIVKYKNRLIFYYEVEKKTKKTHKEPQELTFSLHLLLFVGHDDSNGVPHCLFPGGLTGH